MATDGQASFVFFIYSDVQWGIANIGFNAGDGVRFFMVPGALTPQTRNIENGSNVNVSGLYIYRVDQNTVFEPGEKLNNVFVMATSMHPYVSDGVVDFISRFSCTVTTLHVYFHSLTAKSDGYTLTS